MSPGQQAEFDNFKRRRSKRAAISRNCAKNLPRRIESRCVLDQVVNIGVVPLLVAAASDWGWRIARRRPHGGDNRKLFDPARMRCLCCARDSPVLAGPWRVAQRLGGPRSATTLRKTAATRSRKCSIVYTVRTRRTPRY